MHINNIIHAYTIHGSNAGCLKLWKTMRRHHLHRHRTYCCYEERARRGTFVSLFSDMSHSNLNQSCYAMTEWHLSMSPCFEFNFLDVFYKHMDEKENEGERCEKLAYISPHLLESLTQMITYIYVWHTLTTVCVRYAYIELDEEYGLWFTHRTHTRTSHILRKR